MDKNIPIRTRTIGGFDKQQVDEYIALLKDEYEHISSGDDISAIRNEINELRKAVHEKKDELNRLKKMYDEFENDMNEKPDFDNLTESTKKFLDAHNEVVSIADETSDYINSAETKLPEILKSLSQATKTVDKLSHELSEILDKFDNIPTPNKTSLYDNTEPDIFSLFENEI